MKFPKGDKMKNKNKILAYLLIVYIIIIMLLTYTHIFNELGHALNLRRASFYYQGEWINADKDKLDSFKALNNNRANVRYYSDSDVFFIYLAAGIILWIIIKKIENDEENNEEEVEL